MPDTDPEARDARTQRSKGRIRLDRAAAEGIHLPTVKELLLGCPFLSKDIRIDSAAFAERIMGRVDVSTDGGRQVHAALSALTAAPDLAAVELAASAIRAAVNADTLDIGIDAVAALDRLDYAAANLGSSAACVRVAETALALANGDDMEIDEVSLLTEAAVGWLASARSASPFLLRGREKMSRWSEHRLAAGRDGDRLIKSVLRYHSLLADDIVAAQAGVDVVISDAKAAPPARRLRDGLAGKSGSERVLDVDCDLDEIWQRYDASKMHGVVVIKEIGSPSTHEGKRIVEAYKPVTGVKLPLPPPPDLAAVRQTLTSKFPHAVHVIASVLRDLEGRNHVRLRPTVFVGKPGCGKTTFAVRLLAELGVHHQIYACGGVVDSSLAGTARHWSTGGTSLPVGLAARYRTAAPGIVLDEVSSAGTSRHNGSLTDALLSMVEPVSACRYLDPYLQAETDLSGVIWLATCNDIESLPPALKDRFRIVAFPSPGLEHMPALANELLRQAVEDLGLAAAWATGLDGVELEALATTWNGGSLRGLRKLVEGVLAARDQGQVLS